ncbi:hypothetical protein [Alkalihalobacillus sp. 1P02AB]|uniref:hypothetical protein n=1 Tax=Alkalihalobacillus sp. 1P02AB TaxID=3132260 RepID=UPI0039A76683
MYSHYDLKRIPDGAKPVSVSVNPADIGNKKALRVTLTEKVTNGEPKVDFVDMPTFLKIPENFTNGIITVDLYSRLLNNAPEYARGFAGIAYRINDNHSFESVYLRPLNGLKAKPEPPRDSRAVQYFSYPYWQYDRLRTEHPGQFETGANIGSSEWINLKLVVNGTILKVFINGVENLTLAETKADVSTGDIGLFVDIGTEAFFSNLHIKHQ